jgi:hypothetical protein
MSDLRAELEAVERAASERLSSAGSEVEIESIRHDLLGRSGHLT